MAIVIATSNKKGWPGKTSSATNTAQVLSKKLKKKVLVIDLDEQCNLSQSILWKENFVENKETGELFNLKSKIKIKDLIIKKTKNFHIIPGSVDALYLFNIILENNNKVIWKASQKLEDICKNISKGSVKDIQKVSTILKGVMFDREEWVKVFKKNLSEVEGDYDYIILDLPPSVSMITESAWVISDYLLVPISDYFALNGAEWLVEKMIEIKRDYNDNLRFIFFFNKVPLSSNLFWKNHVNKEYAKLMNGFREAIEENEVLSSISHIMDNVIRESRDIEKSHWSGKSLLEFKDSKALEDYVHFSKELHTLCKNA